MNFRKYIALCLFFICVPDLYAHHVLLNPGVEKQKIQSSISFKQESSDYVLNGAKGSWWKLSGSLKLKVFDWLGVWGSAPFARVAHGDEAPASGLADTEVAVETIPVDLHQYGLGLVLGAGIEFPSGDPHKGLGGGHKAAFGYMSLTWTPSTAWYLYSNTVFASALGGSHEHAPGTSDHLASSVLNPHKSKEIVVSLGLGLVREFGFIEASVVSIIELEGDAAVGPTVAQLRLGVSLDSAWILEGEVSVPVTDDARFLWKTGVGLTYRWSKAADTEDCGCSNPAAHGK